MQAVKLIIDGSYWDSQIYSGELILFDFDGAIHRVEWNCVIDSMAKKYEAVQTAIRVAFSDSDLFYNQKVRKILCDPHIEHPIKRQLKELSGFDASATKNEWHKHWRTEDTPFNFLPTDTDIYYNHIFAGGNDGLFSTPKNGLGSARTFGKTAIKKHHDARIFQIRASDRYTAIAAAAGNDGLFEFDFKRNESDILEKYKKLSSRDCNACDWAFQSVMGWTSTNSFLANFRQDRDKASNQIIRNFDRIIEPKEIFSDGCGFSWGSREKFYKISHNGIEVTNFSPIEIKQKNNRKTINKSLFTKIGSVPLDFDATNVIATGTASFGTVLEFEDKIVVIRSDGKIDTFRGEVVHWRIFPRSENYSNQLHIIYDDKLCIISFVHDYFVNQSSKLSGFSRGSNE